MNLIKTGVLSALSTAVRMATGFIVNKVVAVYIGPSGVALIGQFINFVTIIMSFATGAISNGVTKYTAEYYDDYYKKNKMLSNALIITVVCSILASIVVILGHDYFANTLLKDPKYGSIFLIFGFTLVIFTLNGLCLSILNGHKEIKKFITLNIITSLVSLVFTVLLIMFFGLYGALLSCVTAPTVVFLVTLCFIFNSEWFRIETFIQGFEKESFIKLGKYSLMTIISSVAVPVSQILARNYIADSFSIDSAGYWQGVIKISDVYLMLITTSLGVYYLPKLSSLKTNQEIRKELFYGYKVIMPVAILMALAIYVFREPIILILFSSKFMAMSDLFLYQLIGDVLKMASWLLGFIMVAKAMTRHFIITEIVFNISYVLLVMFFVKTNGLIGSTQAFAINYFLYLLAMIYIFRDLLFNRRPVNE